MVASRRVPMGQSSLNVARQLSPELLRREFVLPALLQRHGAMHADALHTPIQRAARDWERTLRQLRMSATLPYGPASRVAAPDGFIAYLQKTAEVGNAQQQVAAVSS